MSDSRLQGDSRLRLTVLGWSLSATFVITYVLCVLYGLLGFSAEAHATLFPAMLPGFTWITWPSFFIGLVEVVIYGWYFALVFGGIFNFLARRSGV